MVRRPTCLRVLHNNYYGCYGARTIKKEICFVNKKNIMYSCDYVETILLFENVCIIWGKPEIL